MDIKLIVRSGNIFIFSIISPIDIFLMRVWQTSDTIKRLLQFFEMIFVKKSKQKFVHICQLDNSLIS